MKLDEAAHRMLLTGKWYNSTNLSEELGVNKMVAATILQNIRNSKRVDCSVKEYPDRRYRVDGIDGIQHKRPNLWRLAIFGEPQ